MTERPPEMAPTEARWLSASAAAQYVGVTLEEFLGEVDEGVWPKPQRKTNKRELWDRKSLDVASDIISGIPNPANFDLSKDLLDVDETAALLRAGVDKVRRIPKTNLPACRPGKRNLYLRTDVLAYAVSTVPTGQNTVDQAAIDRALKGFR